VRVQGAVTVVTGGGNGIGAAMARRFAQDGAAGVLVADLDEAAALRVADEVRSLGVPAIAGRVDVADRSQVEAMIVAAEDEFGPVDLLCSNAGIGTGAGLDATAEVWQRAWEVNVLAHVYGAQAVLPSMLERGHGALVHTCSAAGLLTMLGDAPYAVTKHAAVAFAEWLSITYGPLGIQVHALCPQGVDTQLLQQSVGTIAGQAVRATGPVLAPDDVAATVVQGLADGRFLLLPHPEVADHLQRKAADPDRWLAALQRIAVGLGATGERP
jgi:NAD(P)-dependent dehydrogenase (short-subunit alcohol dehydrogenase family)